MVSSSSLVMNTDRRARKFHFAGKKVNWKEFNPGLAGTPANPGLLGERIRGVFHAITVCMPYNLFDLS